MNTLDSRNSGHRKDSLIIMEKLRRLILYFSMCFFRNSGLSLYSGHFTADGLIHYYESALYFIERVKGVL